MSSTVGANYNFENKKLQVVVDNVFFNAGFYNAVTRLESTPTRVTWKSRALPNNGTLLYNLALATNFVPSIRSGQWKNR